MNSNGLDIVSVIFLGIAVVIFLYLRSILGSRTGNEPPYNQDHPDNVTTRQRTQHEDNVVSMSDRRENDEQAAPVPQFDINDQVKKFAEPGTELFDSLLEINKKDNSFDPDQFMQGAERAYEMIISAFSQGEKPLLKRLLAKDVYNGFSQAIDDRQANNQTMETQFVGFEKVTLLEAGIEEKQAEITVKFKSSLIRYIEDSTGDIIEGDDKAIEKITDIWTFARNINGRDPNWKLISTKSES